MELEYGFNLWNVDLTNESIEVTYTPEDSIISYEYTLIINGEEQEKVKVENHEPTTILLSKTGTYQIRILLESRDGQRSVTSGLYRIDKERPVITIRSKNKKISTTDEINVMDGVEAKDAQDGNLTKKIKTNASELDFHVPGMKTVTYEVFDAAGNRAVEQATIEVMRSRAFELFAFRTILILIFGIFALVLLRFLKSAMLERRIGKFGVKPLKSNVVSFFEEVHHFYQRILNFLKKGLKKSVFITKYSKRYEKYIGIIDDGFKEGMDLVAHKMMVAFLILMVAILSKTMQSQVIEFYEVVLPLLVGFYLPDLLYLYHYKRYRVTLENDLLQAIIIMNNSFKSGHSITQSIDLVSAELSGPIGREFEKMKVELAFGLSIEDVFKRFSERVKLEEVAYLTASLTILNRTGGNIIEVFSSIEETLFSKRKLKLELQSLTGSSRILMYVLFFVPPIFVLFVSLLNPTYFAPFFASTLGLILFGAILIFYVIYIFLVRRIMKVRM